MKRVLIAMLLAAPVALMTGCQDNSDLQDQIASQQNQIASLEEKIDDLSDAIANSRPATAKDDGPDVDGLNSRLARLEEWQDTEDVRRVNTLEAPGDEGERVEAEAKVNAKMEAAVDKVLAEREEKRQVEREKRREEQAKARAERMENWARIAEENGLEFDKDDPMGSIRKIMMDPEKRAKAMEVMRGEMQKRRNERIGIDEETGKRLNDIESNARTRLTESVANLRETGASADEIAAEVTRINEEKDGEVERLLTEEQFKKYQENPGGGMIPGAGDWGRMIPGFGGGSRRR